MLTTLSKIGKKLSFIKRDYELRRVPTPLVTGIINSENSSIHWPHLEVNGLTVLDMGCGRWEVNGDINETSPVFFKAKGAKRIIGVDADNSEVEFFNNYFRENFQDGSTFHYKWIKRPTQIIDLIHQNSVGAIKCDIEGAEINLFKIDLPSLSSVQTLSIEYHSSVLLKELVLANNRWGFKVIDHSIFDRFPHMGVITLRRV
jgi:hypothetical protein